MSEEQWPAGIAFTVLVSFEWSIGTFGTGIRTRAGVLVGEAGDDWPRLVTKAVEMLRTYGPGDEEIPEHAEVIRLQIDRMEVR